MREFTTEEKIGRLYDMSISQKEVERVNELLSKFDEYDMKLISEVCDINFKIGFRVASELLTK